MLSSRSRLRIAFAIVAIAGFVSLPANAALATVNVPSLSAEPSYLWHLDYASAQSPGSSDDIVTASSEASQPTAATIVLEAGDYLLSGESVTSPNAWYRLTLEPDGQLVLRDTDDGLGAFGLLWSSGPVEAQSPNKAITPLLVMRPDGELVIYDIAGPAPSDSQAEPDAAVLWSSGSRSTTGAALLLDDSGSLSIITPDGRALWHAGNSAPDVGLAGSRHIVYDRTNNWLWLIGANGSVVDNYPVSGNATLPDPGRWRVTSMSKTTIAYNGLLTMKHMVRFATGRLGRSIGFHSIPRDLRGVPDQTEEQLGNYLSAGCVRQRDDKAERLYEWAHIGMPVVVLSENTA